MPHKLTRAEVEKIYPRSMFPNDCAWEATVETRIGCSTCRGCEHFIDVEFYVHECCLTFHGVCRKLEQAIFCKDIAPCSVSKNL